jgi:hypothetical protein
MNARPTLDLSHPGQREPRPTSLVWLDSREAIILRPEGERIVVGHVESNVPPHHRGACHVRHDPQVRHGGGLAQASVDRNRQEQLDRFLETVAARLAPGDDLVVIGPGKVREHLARRISELDAARLDARRIVSGRSARRTVPQLMARLRRLIGREPRRRTPVRQGWIAPGRASGRAEQPG